MSMSPLFPLPDPQSSPPRVATRPEHARVVRPNRHQVELEPRNLDSLLASDHPARSIWDLLERLDLRRFYSSIHAVLDGPGRPTTDPRVLLGLWILATIQGVGSARELARLCEEHDAYRWLRGGVPINYHMLADFRTARGEELDQILTQLIGALMAAGEVTLERVAQDGMRVRASAGAASFRRRETLEACLVEARAQVERLAQEREHPGPDVNKRKQRAQERAARERAERVEQALRYLPEVEATKDMQKRKYTKTEQERVTQARASTSDPEARVMKMPDGGFRPAYNVQFATDRQNGIIVGVAVINAGTDAGQTTPMVEQIERRTGAKPKDYLVDGGYATRADITSLSQKGITAYAPVRLPRNQPEDKRYEPRYGDSPEVADWRQRMATEDAKTVYRQRGSLAEWTNAQTRLHGISQFNVRGIAKATAASLFVAIAHNFLRWMSLPG